MSTRKQNVADAVDELQHHCVNRQLSASNIDAVEIVLSELEVLQDRIRVLESKAFLRRPIARAKKLKPGFYQIGENIKLVVE